jgi:hypothetical protein
MTEYIDREAANLALAEQGFDWDKVKQALASVPAADVVPVVRCKDCKYAYINSFSAASGVALCSSSAKVMQQDDFCSYGERKDGDTDDEV